MTRNCIGQIGYELTNHLGNVNVVITDRKVVNTNYVVNTFTNSTNSWGACTNSTLTTGASALTVNASSGSNNCIFKQITTTANTPYVVRIKSAKGTVSAGLRVSIWGGATLLKQVPLADNDFSHVVFTANGANVTIILEPISGNGVYTVDEVSLTPNSIYEAVSVMKADYYPYGMEMPGRVTNSGAYRYAYNGMEVDPEAKGNGNSYTTEFRQYDPRLGRWLSLDPLMAQFPWQSPYCAFDNNPIFYTDPYGLSADGSGDPPNLKLKTLATGQKILDIFPETAYKDFETEMSLLPDGGKESNFYDWYFDENKVKNVDVIIHHGNANIDPETGNKYDSGGKAGGHVMIHFDGYTGNKVYGFTGAGVKDKNDDGNIDKMKDVPLFPTEHPDPKLKGHYYSQIHGSEHYGSYPKIMTGKIKNGGITTVFPIPATRSQFYAIQNFFVQNLNKDPYPYSIFGGERCASAVFNELSKAGLVSGNHGLSPRKLFNYLITMNLAVKIIISENVKDGTLDLNKIFTGDSDFRNKIESIINKPQ